MATNAEMWETARSLPRHSLELHLTVVATDLLRVLTLLPPTITVGQFSLTVTEWERPHEGWTGRLGRLPGVASCLTRYPVEEPGAAEVEVRVSEPAPLADVARAVYPLLEVERGLHGRGRPELGTAELPIAGLGLLPSRLAPGIPSLPSPHLRGVGLDRVDLALVGGEGTMADLAPADDDPDEDTERVLVGHRVIVDATGHLAVSDRTEAPLVDLNVHNPVGRLYSFDVSIALVELTVEHGELVFTPVGPSPRTRLPGNRNARRYRDHVDLEGWSRPVAAPLSAQEVRRLREVELISLSRLRPQTREDELLLYRRLAELAATGVILHSLPESFGLADQVLGSELADLLRAPYRPTTGLVRELRTVPQRREAMRRFGGFFELAGHASHLGHRLLPSVSVVLSSMRPSRVTGVLRALAAQSYPHVEVAVALHGIDAPTDPAFAEAARSCGAQVMTYDRSTSFGSVLADAAARTTGDLVMKVDDDDLYGPRVIEDLVLAYLYSNADIVGKTTEYLYFEELDHTVHRRFITERYHYQVAGGAMMLSRAALNEIGGWRPTPSATDRSILIRIGNSGGIGYRTQSLGYIYVRHTDGHTWERADSMLVNRAPEQWPRLLDEIIQA